MSTQIKKNGNWVTVAGGTRMWVGTKAALQAALDAGELEDGTAVMVTDDYEEGDRAYVRDQNTLSDWEDVAQSFTAQYDGYYSCSLMGTTTGDWTGLRVSVNGTVIAFGGVNTGSATSKGSQVCLPIKKGDVISVNWSAAGVTSINKVRYYKNRDYSDR